MYIVDNESKLLNEGWLLTVNDEVDKVVAPYPTLRIKTYTKKLRGPLSLEICFGYEIDKAGKQVAGATLTVHLISNNDSVQLPFTYQSEADMLAYLLRETEVQHDNA